MVSFAGIGSGLDVNSMVSKLMQVEKQTMNSLQRKDNTFQAKISSYGELKNALSNFQTAMEDLSTMDKFALYKTNVSEKDDIDITTNSQASPGMYTFNVSQLATSHKVASTTSFADSTASTSLAGTVEITVGSESFEITIDSNGDSLVDIRNTINSASDNVGVKATIMNVDDGFGDTVSRLVLTATDTGSDNTVTLNDISGDVGSGLDITDEMQAAKDAVFTLDGFSITRASNTVTDAIDGITVELKEANNQAIYVNVDNDVDEVVDTVQEFIDSYNKLSDLIDKVSYYDTATQDTRSKNNGKLWDESGVGTISRQLRQEISNPATGAGTFELLTQVGITARSKSSDDALSIDKDKLKAALQDDFDSVAKLFAKEDDGFAVRLNELAQDMLDDEGFIEVRTGSLNESMKQLGTKIDREQSRLDDKEASYFKEFAKLDVIMSKFDQLNQYLISTLGVPQM